MAFSTPVAFLLLALVPALVLFNAWAFRRKDARLARFAAASALPRLVRAVSRQRQMGKAMMLVACVGLVSLALTGPRLGYHWEEIATRGRDIVLAVDVSRSMLAEDVSPSRLERAKRKVVDLLKLFEGDRVGLVAFAGRAYVQCPLTLDYGALETLLQSLDPDSVSVPGTALGDAIDRSLEALGDKDRATRAIVLLTDGESFDGDPMAAATRAKERGVRVYALGIGKDSGAPLRLPDGGFKKDASGNVILTKLDEKTLERVASVTGGELVRSVSSDEDIQEIHRHFQDAGPDRELKGGRRRLYEERYQWPLFFALLLLILEALLPEGPGDRVPLRSGLAFLRGRRAAATVVLLALLGLPAGATAASASAEAARGAEAYGKGDYETALKHYLSAQVEDPGNPAIRYDLASTYYKLGRYAEAEKLFGAGAAERDAALSAKSRYNLGNTLFREGKLEDAAREYEEALRHSPQDDDAKHNLEVARREIERRKAQPPPSSNDDKRQQQQQGQQQQQQQQQQGQQSQPAQDERSAKDGKRPDEGAQKSPQEAQDRAGRKAPDPKEAQGAKGQEDEPRTGEAKRAGEQGRDAPMKKDEAENWLARLHEGKKRDPKGQRAKTRTQVEKDW